MKTFANDVAAPLGLGQTFPEDGFWILGSSALTALCEGDGTLFWAWLTEADAWRFRQYKIDSGSTTKDGYPYTRYIPKPRTFDALRDSKTRLLACVGVVVLDDQGNEITRRYWA